MLQKGLIASPDTLDIYDENGKLVWSRQRMLFWIRMLRIQRIQVLERYTAESYLWSFLK